MGLLAVRATQLARRVFLLDFCLLLCLWCYAVKALMKVACQSSSSSRHGLGRLGPVASETASMRTGRCASHLTHATNGYDRAGIQSLLRFCSLL